MPLPDIKKDIKRNNPFIKLLISKSRNKVYHNATVKYQKRYQEKWCYDKATSIKIKNIVYNNQIIEKISRCYDQTASLKVKK